MSVRGGADKRKIHTKFNENLHESSTSVVRLEEEGRCCSGLLCWDSEGLGYDLRMKQIMQYGMMGWGGPSELMRSVNDSGHPHLLIYIDLPVSARRKVQLRCVYPQGRQFPRMTTIPRRASRECGASRTTPKIIMGIINNKVNIPVQRLFGIRT